MFQLEFWVDLEFLLVKKRGGDWPNHFVTNKLNHFPIDLIFLMVCHCITTILEKTVFHFVLKNEHQHWKSLLLNEFATHRISNIFYI